MGSKSVCVCVWDEVMTKKKQKTHKQKVANTRKSVIEIIRIAAYQPTNAPVGRPPNAAT